MANYKDTTKPSKFHLTGSQTILLGFLVLILAGTALLMLPIATKDRSSTDFTEAFFTATSASCVTGLVVKDTQSTWSMFGQVVILILIQIGGMGVVTITTLLTTLAGRKIGLSTRSTMQEAVSAPNLGGIVRHMSFIIKGTIMFELMGAVIMSPVFIKDFGPIKGIWYSLFTAISAFCNAGFDLNGSYGAFSSMVPYSNNPVIVITLFCLILTGGLGFITWKDIKDHGFKFRYYSTQSKLIIVCEIILISVPFLLLFFLEYQDLPTKNRILASLFQSITPRTAGFNTTDYNNFSDAGIALTIILMLIGGAPGSTAGGMKITTVAILLIATYSTFRREKTPSVFKRRIPLDIVESAVAVFALDLTLSLSGAMIISRIEDLPMRATFFESASAVATVGLSLGITPDLGTISRYLLIFLMFVGRVGGMTLVFAAIARKRTTSGEYPKDHIAVG
ncbi:MAG: Trk family potassium uptake protein [Saccharofermentans sp.]|nr:Trk family potassium uptake protein [Saccharofermentans sp.]